MKRNKQHLSLIFEKGDAYKRKNIVIYILNKCVHFHVLLFPSPWEINQGLIYAFEMTKWQNFPSKAKWLFNSIKLFLVNLECNFRNLGELFFTRSQKLLILTIFSHLDNSWQNENFFQELGTAIFTLIVSKLDANFKKNP